MGSIKKKKKHLKTNQPKTRKELRKEQRKMKKQRRHEYYTNKRKPDKLVSGLSEAEITGKKDSRKDSKEAPVKQNNRKGASQNPGNVVFDSVKTEKKQQEKLQKEMHKQRNKQLIEANVEEDRNIRQLEKQLKLHKRKCKSIPKTFASEGLDYILEVCDSDNIKDVYVEKELNDSGSEFEEDFALITNQPVKKLKKKHKEESMSDAEEELNDAASESDQNDSDLSNDSNASIMESDDEELISESDGSTHNNEEFKSASYTQKKRKSIENDVSKKKQRKESLSDISQELSDKENDASEDSDKESEIWEDIYGRTRAKDGTVVTNSNKYIPPAIRAKMENELPIDKKRMEKLTRLKRQIKGLLNRLAEANIHNISTQIEDLYMNNSRNDMNETVTNIMLESLVSHVITPERLLIEHVLLITILHANVGTEVGAHFLHTVVKQFEMFFNAEHEVENKKLDNTVNIIAQLYNFKIFNSKLLYELLSKLSNKFDEKSVECILLVLKNVGFSLRKDDPLALKELIIKLQKQAANVTDETNENVRVRFMLDILLAIKNNNVSKIPNYDTSYSEHLKKLQKNFIRKGNYITQLNISLEDLLQADERGRWWIVGSAWSGKKEENLEQNKTIQTEGYSQKLLDLARKQRMNTDTRRNIFCIIMSAEDYVDAFEKLLHLGLKNQQEREIIHVLLHCCLQEKEFNPYYAVLAQKFCECDRKYQMIIKCSVWDKVKALIGCSPSQISNLAKLLTHLFLEKGLPISTLKVLEFSELDKTTLRFVRQILLGILLYKDAETCTSVFDKIAQSDKLKMFRESLRLFIHHFLLKNLKAGKIPEDQQNLLKSRCDLVEKMLVVNDKRTRF